MVISKNRQRVVRHSDFSSGSWFLSNSLLYSLVEETGDKCSFWEIKEQIVILSKIFRMFVKK